MSAESYTYSLWDEAIPAPDAYRWERSVRAVDLEIDGINNITDVFYRNHKIYIAMQGQIVVTDEEFHTDFIITSYMRDQEIKNVIAPKCIFVTEENQIYITEEDAGEVIQFDENGNFVRAIGNPSIKGLEGIKYAPTKVVVDNTGRIYIKAKSVYEGIIELAPSGKFNRFVGANEVMPNFLDRFYRLIATQEQISRMALWLPTDYSDIAMDQDGFLLATVKDAKSILPIRKLNSSGEDILNMYEFITPPMGDYIDRRSISALTNIAAAEDGRFAVLDSSRSRVFVYSGDGMLAYVLGGSGKREGSLNSPIDIAFMGDKILIADLVSCSIEVFNVTEYGALINNALELTSKFEYEKAAYYWEQVNEISPGSVIANMGLGKYRLRSEDFKGAMESFKATGERENYSAAYERVRENFIEQNFGMILFGFVVIIAILILLKRLIRSLARRGYFEQNKVLSALKKVYYECFTWPGYVLSHPFKAFDDIKYLDKGNTWFCFVVLALFAWMNLIKTRYAGFLVNYVNISMINIPLLLASSLFPYLIFIVANWAVGVLIDGKGNLRNIFKVNMYAIYPSVFLYLIGTLLSRIIIYDEAALVNFLFYLPLVIYVFYTFIGLIMIHQFSFTKGLVSVILSFIAMAIIIFVIVLLLTLVSGFINDIFTIVDEISLYL
jgi:hypothetical protein